MAVVRRTQAFNGKAEEGMGKRRIEGLGSRWAKPHLGGAVAELHLPDGDVAVSEEPADHGGRVAMTGICWCRVQWTFCRALASAERAWTTWWDDMCWHPSTAALRPYCLVLLQHIDAGPHGTMQQATLGMIYRDGCPASPLPGDPVLGGLQHLDGDGQGARSNPPQAALGVQERLCSAGWRLTAWWSPSARWR